METKKGYSEKELERFSMEYLHTVLKDREPDRESLKKQIMTAQYTDIDAMWNANYEIMKIQDKYEMQMYLSFSAKKGNIFSMLYLAESLMNQDYPQKSQMEYELWLCKIMENNLVQKFIQCRHNGERMDEINDESEWKLLFLVGKACFELGMYYRYSETIEELKKARNNIINAKVCQFFSDFNTYHVEEIISDIDERIRRLDDPNYNQVFLHEQLEMFIGIDEDLSIDEKISCLKDRLIQEIGVEIWNQFKQPTKSCLLTGVICYYTLMNIINDSGDDIDYSCVVIPLMKCIEYELRVRFFDHYIEYLNSRFDIDSFFEYNVIDEDERKTEVEKRGGIIYWNGEKYQYIDHKRSSHFTLGSFVYVTGIRSIYRMMPYGTYSDNTMLEYCKTVLFRKKDSDDETIDHWLYNLAVMIRDLQTTRNHSAHGGSVTNVYTARETLKILILTKKILIQLVETCNS